MLVGTCHCLKFTVVFAAIFFFWIWTNGQKELQLNVLHELAQEKLLPLNYHHDTIFSNNSFNTNMNEEEKSRSKTYANIKQREIEIHLNAVASGELEKLEFVPGAEKNQANL